jgi:hypothetical protein
MQIKSTGNQEEHSEQGAAGFLKPQTQVSVHIMSREKAFVEEAFETVVKIYNNGTQL